MPDPASRLARLEVAVQAIDHQVRALGPTSGQIIEAAAGVAEAQRRIDQNDRELDAVEHRLTEQIRAVAKGCAEIRAAVESDNVRRDENRGKIVVAVIMACATVLASIIGAVVVIFTQGPT